MFDWAEDPQVSSDRTGHARVHQTPLGGTVGLTFVEYLCVCVCVREKKSVYLC